MVIPRPDRLTPKLAGLLSSVLVLLVALAVWWLQGGATTTTTEEQPTRTATSSATPATQDAPTSEAPDAPGTSAAGTSQAVQPTATATSAGGQVQGDPLRFGHGAMMPARPPAAGRHGGRRRDRSVERLDAVVGARAAQQHLERRNTAGAPGEHGADPLERLR